MRAEEEGAADPREHPESSRLAALKARVASSGSNAWSPGVALLDARGGELPEYHVLLSYDVPLEWCHSYDKTQSVGTKEGDANLPVAQGGLLGAIADNALAVAVHLASDGRFLTTLGLTLEMLRHVRPGPVWVSARATFVGSTVAFAEATIFSDEARSRPAVKATTTCKLRKPPPSATSKL